MEQRESQQPNSVEQPAGAKAYWKPSVQLYGTQSDVTRSSNNGTPHLLDGGGGPLIRT